MLNRACAITGPIWLCPCTWTRLLWSTGSSFFPWLLLHIIVPHCSTWIYYQKESHAWYLVVFLGSIRMELCFFSVPKDTPKFTSIGSWDLGISRHLINMRSKFFEIPYWENVLSWICSHLSGYKINERINLESPFCSVNKDSEVWFWSEIPLWPLMSKINVLSNAPFDTLKS